MKSPHSVECMDIKKQKEGLYLEVFIVILNNCK